MNTILKGKHIISTSTGRVFDFLVLGTVDKWTSLCEGSVVDILYVEVTGYNTRVTFRVVDSFCVYSCERIAKNGALGYFDFVNESRNEITEKAASYFVWSKQLNR